MQLSAFGMMVDVFDLFYDQKEIGIDPIEIADFDAEEESENEKAEKEGEEKEVEDADEKEYYALHQHRNSFLKSLSSFDSYYLQTQYSVMLNITAEPPELK